MFLLINYYIDKDENRQQEYELCLKNNLENSLISKIFIFHEKNVKIPIHEKIVSKICTHRPTYNEFFFYGNLLNGIKILANLDICFNETLKFANQINNNQIFALTRWDITNKGIEFYNKESSQDVWIWKSKINVDVNFGLGIPGCDNVIAYKLKCEGYNIINPSLTIKVVHIHYTGKRNYEIKKGINKMQLPQPYLFLKPCKL